MSDLVIKKQEKCIVEYAKPNVFALSASDHHALLIAKNVWTKKMYIKTSSEILILAFRVLVKQGVIPHTEIRFKFGRQMIKIDKNGELDKYPPGFCETYTNLLSMLV